jgi:hypothetical protein
VRGLDVAAVTEPAPQLEQLDLFLSQQGVLETAIDQGELRRRLVDAVGQLSREVEGFTMGRRELEHAARLQQRIPGTVELLGQQRHELEPDRQLVGPGQMGELRLEQRRERG